MAVTLGFQCKMFYGAAGSPATIELTNVADADFNLSKTEADVTTRGNLGWEAVVGVIKQGEVSFEMVWDTEEAAFTYFLNAWLNDLPVAMKILDGKGGSGLDADFSVIDIGRSEPLKEAVKAKINVKPTYSTRAPAWQS